MDEQTKSVISEKKNKSDRVCEDYQSFRLLFSIFDSAEYLRTHLLFLSVIYCQFIKSKLKKVTLSSILGTLSCVFGIITLLEDLRICG